MACGKVPGFNQVVGLWTNPRTVLDQYQIPDKIKGLQRDQLIAGGNPYELWLPAREGATSVKLCDCLRGRRESPSSEAVGSQSPNTKCEKCYGVGLTPGYFKFLHETLYFASNEYTTFALTAVERSTEYVSPRLALIEGSLTGAVITADKAYSNPNEDNWEVDAKIYREEAGGTSLVEFSTNAGGTWTAIAAINGVNKPVGSGNIRLRITLTRVSVDDYSPAFSIVRLRHLRSADANAEPISATAGTARPLVAGQILLLKTWQSQQWGASEDRGITQDLEADRSWTTGLSFFDSSITPDTPADAIRSNDTANPAFVRRAFGIFSDERISLYAPRYSEELRKFTRQEFTERRVQAGEILMRVW